MNKLLRYPLIFVFLLIANLANSQSSTTINHSNHEQENIFSFLTDQPILIQNHVFSKKKVFSYDFNVVETENDHADHDHANDVVLLDIIFSDEGSDFNCSGGFCMNKSHFHKKGLSMKKQLFDYFMSIAC
ncbi:hypothetical protein IWQ47_002039 [Aquimarina sp. EL_43]|uniref:hypothetical protein n=1 Tax=Aquimarina TaxID=290174 RepID=UPI00046F9ECB|nr:MULTISPECIES: hypothetical protein [Aquimarina]MBG6130563.1 hypothetical protein [Aquimarina sp. EL_35]MBG6151291.1 hypothetical protein [Aquimarina sp. EL_32]MBG6168965.1 hypothetical protein [Aquimarina sp. EL_43]